MIKLENVTVFKADEYYSKKIRTIKIQELSFLEEYNIKTFADLETIIYSGIEVPQYLVTLYELTKKEIDSRRLAGKEPQTYKTKFPMDNDLNKYAILKTEAETKCKDLILDNPIYCHGYHITFQEIKEESIKDIRFLLNFVSPNGENALKLFQYIRNNEIKKILVALKLYEEQVIRQARGKDVSDVNLFYLDEDKKRKIVLEELDSFIEYFLQLPSNYNFIWGNRTNSTIKLLNDCLENYTFIPSKSVSKVIKRDLINIFTHYMTLEELERGAIENHTLDRFIFKKTPSNNVK